MRTSRTSFLPFWIWIRIRVRIVNPDPDMDPESPMNLDPDPDPQHYLQPCMTGRTERHSRFNLPSHRTPHLLLAAAPVGLAAGPPSRWNLTEPLSSPVCLIKALKVPKCEIFHLFDFNDFYGIKSL
jgi:hypothetical protein